MKNYKELAKIYHMDNSSLRDTKLLEEHEARLNADSTFHTDFFTANGELFIAVPRELSVLSEHILRTDRKVSRLMGKLPSIAQSAVLRSMVLDEVVCSNAIENIHSTRKQISDVLNVKSGDREKQMRFREIAMLYLAIIDGKDSLPQSPEDIRAIYDRVTSGEISEDNVLDGDIFRKGGVNVISNGVKVVHNGVEPEAKIIEDMDRMLKLLKNEEIPALYSTIASHYIFEYMHPFYDGNGRTGRYLLSLYLSKVLSIPTALSLSKTIAENKGAYYRAFQDVEKPLNHAELTFFIETILKMIKTAQIDIIELLQSSLVTLDNLDDIMQGISADKQTKRKELDIIYLLLHHEAFGLFGDVALVEIANYLGIKTQQARKYLTSLSDKKICKKVSVYNPVSYALTDDFKKAHNIRFD